MQGDAQMATLEELFEFIDCCVCPDVFTDNIDATDPWCEHAMLPPLDFPTDTTQGSPTTIDRTPRSPETNGPPTKPKQLQFLREHVRDLEVYAERLKKRVALITKENGMEGERACNWQDMAAVEYAERKKSEEMNLTLRRIMDNQLQVSAALRLIADHNEYGK
ncbi:hypothetical protein GQ600_7020 [Phytophthora cactorum]|nr:hypothetical protein GQ600_7020 [Phytophthora cactorum]